MTTVMAQQTTVLTASIPTDHSHCIEQPTSDCESCQDIIQDIKSHQQLLGLSTTSEECKIKIAWETEPYHTGPIETRFVHKPSIKVMQRNIQEQKYKHLIATLAKLKHTS
jgi:hypothetical protein